MNVDFLQPCVAASAHATVVADAAKLCPAAVTNLINAATMIGRREDYLPQYKAAVAEGAFRRCGAKTSSGGRCRRAARRRILR